MLKQFNIGIVNYLAWKNTYRPDKYELREKKIKCKWSGIQ